MNKNLTALLKKSNFNTVYLPVASFRESRFYGNYRKQGQLLNRVQFLFVVKLHNFQKITGGSCVIAMAFLLLMEQFTKKSALLSSVKPRRFNT